MDEINLKYGGEGTKLYSTANTSIRKTCLQNGLHLLDAQVRHLGTDINYVVLDNLYRDLKGKVDFFFETPVASVAREGKNYRVTTEDGKSYTASHCVVSVGRSGSKWMEGVCRDMGIPTKSNRVDIGVRVELPAQVFSHLTDELYESKIVYRTEKFEDLVRTFCILRSCNVFSLYLCNTLAFYITLFLISFTFIVVLFCLCQQLQFSCSLFIYFIKCNIKWS